MDPNRLKAAYQKLQALDERLTHKVRPRAGGGYSRPGIEQMEERLKHLGNYTVELKEVVHDLFQAIAAKAPQKQPPGEGSTEG